MGERFLDVEEVRGSIPLAPTILTPTLYHETSPKHYLIGIIFAFINIRTHKKEDCMEETSVLKKINFFKDLSSWELMQINKLTERQLFKAGEHIVKEGTKCDAFYIIKDGMIKVEKEGREIATLGSEEPIGEVSFIDSGVRSATITAIQDTVVIKLPSDKFKELMSNSVKIAYKVYKTIAVSLCERLRETNEILIHIH